MFMTATSVGAPRQITSRIGLLKLRPELIERISLTAIILVLFGVTLFAGTAIFLVRSVLTSYEGQQRMLSVETQSSRIAEQDKQIASLNERIGQIDQQIFDLRNTDPDLNDADRSSVPALALAPELWARYGNGVRSEERRVGKE